MLWKGILFLCIRYDYEIHHVDIISVYLKAELKEKIWMQQFHDFKSDNPSQACLLKKAIYGLKQSARMWYETLKEFLISQGFVKIRSDHSVFIHENGTVIAVYVDDLLLTASKLNDFFAFKETLAEKFRVKNLREIKFYFEIKIIRNRKSRKMWFSQTAFIKRLVNDCGFHQLKARPVKTFMKCIDFVTEFNGKAYSAIFDEIHAYQVILRSLQWLATMTRQNIVYATNKLAQFSVNSTPIHMQAAKRVVRYLAETSDLEIRYDPSDEADGNLVSYTDSVYGDDLTTRRSHSSYVFKLWNGPISHSSKRQYTVATSSTEAEYVAECNAAKEAFFIYQAMTELGHQIEGPVNLIADNQGAIKLANNPLNHARTKHIPIQYHYVRELVENGYVRISYVSINEMIADGLIKALPAPKFRNFVAILSLTSSPAKDATNWPIGKNSGGREIEVIKSWNKKEYEVFQLHGWSAMIIKMKVLERLPLIADLAGVTCILTPPG